MYIIFILPKSCKPGYLTLDFNLLFKYDVEYLFVNSECSLQISKACFEVCSDNVR